MVNSARHVEKSVGEAEESRRNDVLDDQLRGLPNAGSKTNSILNFASATDLLIIVLSCAAAVIAGGLNPLLTASILPALTPNPWVLYGQLVGSFDAFQNGSISGSELRSDIAKFTLYFVYLAIGMFVAVYITTTGFYFTGERITRNLRRAYLRAIIGQNMAFFDTLGSGELTTRITSDITLIQEAITGNLSVSLTAAATFISAYIIAFVEYWKLALILTSTVIVLTVTGTVGVALPVKWTTQSLAYYSSGATVAEEAISSIRHVTAFGIQEKLVNKYDSFLVQGERPGLKASVITSLMVGMVNAVPYLSYALSFWEGSRLLLNGEISVSGVTTSTLAIVIGAWAVGRVAPNAKAFVSSIASANAVLEAISRISTQDPFSEDGEQLDDASLDLRFQGVQLVYPSRRDVTVLRNLDLVVPAFKTTAIVGASGCGKSSIIGLIERFYTATAGRITLGDHDIQTLNLRWWRRQISLVGQEPCLFNTTIFDNIAYGLEGTASSLAHNELEKLVVEAATKANAHEFISNLPEGYQTRVGERGTQISGGQRQRICIARAIIKNPRILLLDEATSALDVVAERAVQKALASAAEGRTSIIIAHRLSTIRDADNIVVMAEGRVVEQGTHDELIKRNGLYAHQIAGQTQGSSREGGEGNDKEKVSVLAASLENLSDEKATPDSYTNSLRDIPSEVSDDDEGSETVPATFAWRNLAEAIRLIWRLNQKEIGLIIVGTVLAVLAGLSTPAQSIIFAKLINSLSLTSAQALRHSVDFWSLMYLVTAIGVLIVFIGHGTIFAYTTEKLIHRARLETFRQILRQDVPFFDEERNSIGTLTSLLSTAPTGLKGLSGPVMGAILTFLATIIGGIVLSLAVGWKLALVCTATIPLVAGFGWVRLSMLSLFADKMRKTHEESAAYASEATSAIRTVASLTLETHVLQHYDRILMQKSSESIRSILQASALYAASQSVTFLCAALAFWYGGTLLSTHEYTVTQFFICFAALISGAQTAGVIFSHAPAMSSAIGAAQQLRELFDRRSSTAGSDSESGVTPKETSDAKFGKTDCVGRLEFHNVSYSYPSRKDRVVVDDFSLAIQPGQFVGLVGPSGCGKSTLVALLERFFEPTAGHITVDGRDISTLDVASYRNCISLVGQEPTLFSGTIRENLLLGSPETVSQAAIKQACVDANILDTIISLPDGFETELGSKGLLLSGGQRQRLAIARALLRDTPILLLDEATAALDLGSERVVQEALDKASRRRTTIAIAHRLVTVQKADVICVLDKGRLVDAGSHEDLIRKSGLYADMVKMQNADTESGK